MINIQDKLKEMARLTALSGRICDVQIKNLQMFPLVFFEGIKEVKVDYDLIPNKSMSDDPTNCNSLVSYYLDLDETKNGDLDKRFIALEKSVKNMFWNDIKIEVYFNNQIKYKTPKV